jgi:hypothetical protein
MAAKALGVAGLVSNMTGAVSLWWIVPHGSSMHYGQPTPVPFRPLARVAAKVGWRLLILGFGFELVATVLVP